MYNNLTQKCNNIRHLWNSVYLGQIVSKYHTLYYFQTTIIITNT